jgi:DNA ligase-4
MIVYYDVLLIDDESLLGVKNSGRFQRLTKIITCRKGYAELVSRTSINASQSSAVSAVRELFAQCIASRGEGLVLKPDEPYFDFNAGSRPYNCCNIKLKKEYIQGWGDVGDFAVVGASYDAAKAREYRIPNVKWTHFFIACLENKDRARAKTEMPRFRVTNIVELTGTVLSTFWAQRRPLSVPYDENASIQLDYSRSMLAKRPTALFPHPLVFDMRCFAFDKEPNTNFWSMRFPQVSKVHYDRSYLDTVTFSELQEIAEAGSNIPEEEDSQEMRQWVKALKKMDRGKSSVGAISQATTCSDVPPSPSSSTSSQPIARQPKHDLPTPPTSSAVEAIAVSADTECTSPIRSVSNRGKRSVTELSGSRQIAKRCRTHPVTSSMTSSQQTTSTVLSFSHTRQREPLSQVDINLPEKHSKGPDHHTSALPPENQPVQNDVDLQVEKQPAPSSPAAYYTASEMFSSPNRNTRTRRKTAPGRSQSKACKTSSPCCTIAGHQCALVNCSVLLSPCISSYAWLTDDLLRRHGISDPLLDARVWSNGELQTHKGSGDCGSATTQATPGRTRRRVRKICLVESRRKEATEAFLQKIKAADLRKRGGEREWVAVYDWRVLECITEQEEKENSLRGKDPWRRYYVGIA